MTLNDEYWMKKAVSLANEALHLRVLPPYQCDLSFETDKLAHEMEGKSYQAKALKAKLDKKRDE